MSAVETLLVDAREQVRTALAAMEPDVAFTLRSVYPREGLTGSVVVWGEYANTATDCPVVDRIVFQTDIYAADRDSRDALCQSVNQALTGLGLRRVYASPDEYRDEGEGIYFKRYRFARWVDKRSMRLISVRNRNQ